MFVRVYRARARGFGRVRVFALPKRKEPPEGALVANTGPSTFPACPCLATSAPGRIPGPPSSAALAAKLFKLFGD